MIRERLLDIFEPGHRPDRPDNPTYLTAKMLRQIDLLAQMCMGLGFIVGLLIGLAIGFAA